MQRSYFMLEEDLQPEKGHHGQAQKEMASVSDYIEESQLENQLAQSDLFKVFLID